MTEKSAISLADPAIQRCPFHANKQLREETPVYLDPITGHYVVSRYDDVFEASLDVARLANDTGLSLPTRQSDVQEQVDKIYAEKGWLPINTLVTNDPPDHRFFRSLVDKVFTPRRVAKMEPYIGNMIDELIDGFINDGEVELVSRFAVPLPMTVIADQLGVPRADLALFKKWSDESMKVISPMTTPEAEIAFAHLMTEMQQYFNSKAEDPATMARDCIFRDLLSVDVDGRKLAMREFMSITHNLLVAGNETTTHGIASGVQLMIENPDRVREMREKPETISAFVEETLRLRAPIQGLARKATTDLDIHGTRIPKGAIVILRYGAANLDPEKFERPEEVNLHRTSPKSHLAFGVGPHFCIGHQLARTEMQMAFARILQRMENLRYAEGTASCEYAEMYIAYGLKKLHIAFDRRRRDAMNEQYQ